MHYSNFKLSKEAEEFAKKLIEKAEKDYERLGGVICKSNIKLDDNLNVIEDSDE